MLLDELSPESTDLAMVFRVSKGRVTITVLDIMTVVTVPSLDGLEVRLDRLTAALWQQAFEWTPCSGLITSTRRERRLRFDVRDTFHI